MESDNEEVALIANEVVEGETIHEHDSAKSRIASQVLYPLVLALSFALIVSSPVLDHYFTMEASKVSIPIPTGGLKSFKIVRGDIGSEAIVLYGSGSGSGTTVTYECDSAPFDDNDFGVFQEHIIGMGYIHTAFSAINVLSVLGMALLGLALVVQVVLRKFPSTHVFRPHSLISRSWKSSLSIWLVVVATAVSLCRLLLLTSFVQSLVTRVVLDSIRSQWDSASWTAFLDEFSNSKKYQVSVLLALGEWYHQFGATWTVSIWTLVFSLGFNVGIFLVVFYFDVRLVRFGFKMDQGQSDSYAQIQRQLKALPRQARIRPLWWSASLLGVAILLTKVVGRYVYNSGRATNLKLWMIPSPTISHTIDDIILSKTGGFWFEPAFVVHATAGVGIPLVIVIVLGSVARVEMMSKFLEVVAMGYLIRLLSVSLTIFPASAAVLQLPECYSDKVMSLMDAMMTMEFCNDMMYSGHACLTITPAVIIVFMLIYGPYRDKLSVLLAMGIVVLVSTGVVITGRFHYTSDVVVSLFICILLGLVNAPAWKVLFSYGLFELKVGSKQSMLKVAAILEEIGMRVVSITRGRRVDYYNTDWDKIERKQLQLRYSIEKLQHTE